MQQQTLLNVSFEENSKWQVGSMSTIKHAIFVIFWMVLLVVLGLILTEIPLKLVRLFVDSQQGSQNAVRLNMALFDKNASNLPAAILWFRQRLDAHRHIVVWPRLTGVVANSSLSLAARPMACHGDFC